MELEPYAAPTWRKSTVLTVTLCVAAILGGAGLAVHAAAGRSGPAAPAGHDPELRSLAVLPLVDRLGGPAREHLVDGMHEALIAELSRMGGLTVISRTSVLRYRDTPSSARAAAEQLGVDAIVEGEVRGIDGEVRVALRLADRAGETLWTEVYEAPVEDALPMQRQVALGLAEEVRITLSDAMARRLDGRTSIDSAAQAAYVRGRAEWSGRSRSGLARAVALLERAVRLDPGFAAAHAALADAYVIARGYGAIDLPWAEAYDRAREAAARALELEPDLAEAHAARAYIRFQADWAVYDAERGLRRATRLSPNYAQAHGWLSQVLRAQGLAEAAVDAARRAHQLDPFSPLMNRYLAFALARADRCLEARDVADDAISLDPDHADAFLVHYGCAVSSAQFDEAVAAHTAVYRRWGIDSAVVAGYRAAFGNGGWQAALRFEIGALERSEIPVRSEYMLAQRQALLGERDRAFEQLERALDARDPLMLFELRLDPLLDSLRGDPRYMALLRRLEAVGSAAPSAGQ